ncbi:MAG: Unknown protein [uncultured Sulfurovum sp.]|uniref:Uncharacterized protein n=2 Tax=uncultured Sulfurovum sp. TaxID=269237 RepID=A0A6S6SU73_9BACT|nr:MAG: Unknown protein [uncultured Sulfurovum sp.]
MIKALLLFILFIFPLIINAQKITYDTLWSISPKVFFYGPKDIESSSYHNFYIDSNIKFEFYSNYLFFKRKQVRHSSIAHYYEDSNEYHEKYQKKIQQGISIEKADSFILYKLTQYASHYHRGDFFTSWGGYEEIEKFDKLQGKYHYIDFYAAYKKRQPIYRNNDWKRTTRDTIIVHDCSIERYLLVDSVIYLFTSTLREPHRNRKRGLRILEREFKQFVRCIWVKEEEELLEG